MVKKIRKVAGIINQIADEIPSGIDWILRVDGHTDSIPITNDINFSDNWELSQARALSVVRYLINDLNIQIFLSASLANYLFYVGKKRHY